MSKLHIPVALRRQSFAARYGRKPKFVRTREGLLHEIAPDEVLTKMLGWKPGQSYRVWFATFNCAYNILSEPRIDRRGDVYVEVEWRGVCGIRRLYQNELSNHIDRINPEE